MRVTTVPQSLWKLLEGQLAYMSQFYEVHAVSSGGEKLEIVKNREGVETYSVEMYRGISIIKDFKSIWNLYRYIKKIKPDIIHSHTPKAGLIAMVSAKMARVPVRLHTVAGMPLESTKGIKRQILISVEKLCYRCAHKIYPNSLGLKEFIIKNKLAPTSKLKVVASGSSNGIDLDYFDIHDSVIEQSKFIREQYFHEDDFIFGFIGRLVKDKGVNELVKAFLSLELPNAKLMLLGKYEDHLDPLLPEVRKEIEKNKKILFVGYQKDVRPYLVAMDVFVFPSHREGLPNVLLQAAAMGKPILASNCNGNTDIIMHDQNGILVNVNDQKALKEQMLNLFNSKELRDRYSVSVRKNIEKRYKREVVWESLREEYSSHLKKL